MTRHPGPHPAQGWPFVVSGVVAAAVLLGVSELASVFFSPVSSSLVAVGAAFIDVTPPWLKDFAIAVFGTADKLVLMVCRGWWRWCWRRCWAWWHAAARPWPRRSSWPSRCCWAQRS